MEKIKRAPKTFIRKWVKALRSGKYKQTTSTLKGHALDDAGNFAGVGYCCLGVACKLKAKEAGNKTSMYKYSEDRSSKGAQLAGRWLLPNNDQFKLAKLNDEGKSFSEIADYIEKKYL